VPKRVEQEQKNLGVGESWTWTSSPITARIWCRGYGGGVVPWEIIAGGMRLVHLAQQKLW